MDEETKTKLLETASRVLELNWHDSYTIPAEDLYEHQWLWDSCFIAIGNRHINLKRAQQEIHSLLQAQWHNGMVPSMIFSSVDHIDSRTWESSLSPNAPKLYATSGITQPPMLAEAVFRIGRKLDPQERQAWFGKIFPHLLKYHQWLYRERDPHKEGLIILVHPWESGMDNSPPWTTAALEIRLPLWITAVNKLKLSVFGNRLRKDTRKIPIEQRASLLDELIFYHVQQRLRRKYYDSEKILMRSHFSVQDLAFNSILIRANTLLQKIADEIKQELPAELLASMQKTESALEELWHKEDKQYYSRSFISYKLIEQPTIATFLPLYAGSISEERAKVLVDGLLSSKFWSKFPIPTVSRHSSYYRGNSYWQGPAWVNTNWLIHDGLRRYGFHEEAEQLRNKTIQMIHDGGFWEYFNPDSGQGLGAKNFSWTASLAADLLLNTDD